MLLTKPLCYRESADIAAADLSQIVRGLRKIKATSIKGAWDVFNPARKTSIGLFFFSNYSKFFLIQFFIFIFIFIRFFFQLLTFLRRV